MAIQKITRVYTRRYTDSGQVTSYVEWIDGRGQKGRTEGCATNAHMSALIARGEREGIPHEAETW